MIWRALMVAAIVVLGVPGCERQTAETEAPETVVGETQASFDSLVSVTNTHIREGNFEAAETTLREMEQMGPELTDAMRQQIQTMRASLTAARAAPPDSPTPPPPAAR